MSGFVRSLGQLLFGGEKLRFLEVLSHVTAGYQLAFCEAVDEILDGLGDLGPIVFVLCFEAICCHQFLEIARIDRELHDSNYTPPFTFATAPGPLSACTQTVTQAASTCD